MKKRHLLASILMLGLIAAAAPFYSAFTAKEAGPVEAGDYPDGEKVYFVDKSGIKHDFGSTTIYKNDGTTGTVSDYNIAYFPSYGLFYLNGYSAGAIGSNEYNKPLTVELIGASVNKIVVENDGANSLYGIKSGGALTIKGTGSLNIRLNSNMGVEVNTYFYGIYAGGAVTIGSESSDNLSIDITSIHTAKYKYGIYAGAKLDLKGHTSIYMLMNTNQIVRGLYCSNGTIDLNISSGKSIIANFSDGNPCANDAKSYCIQAEKDIVITGAGSLEIENNKANKEYASYGVYMGGETDNYHLIKFNDLYKAKIKGFKNGIFVYLNNNNGSEPSNYDVLIKDVDDFKIISDVEDNAGIEMHGSDNYGVKIIDSIFSYKGEGTAVYTTGSNGFDISGESFVTLYQNDNLYAEDYTCDIDLDYGGTFILAKKEEKSFSSELYNDYFYVKLSANNYVVHPEWMKGENNGDGGYLYTLDPNYSCPFMVRGVSKTLSADISVDGVDLDVYNPYFVNGATAPNDSPANYNAYFNFDKNILYLNGYDGGQISYYSSTTDVFRIVVEADSKITDDEYGIYVDGNGSLEILSSGAELNIDLDSSSNDLSGIFVNNGSLDLLQDIHLKIDVNAKGNDHIASGIFLYTGDLSILERACLDIDVHSEDTSLFHEHKNSAIVAVKVIVDVSDDSDIDLNVMDVKSGAYTITATEISIASISVIQMHWDASADEGGAFYPEDALDGQTNITVNIGDNYGSIFGGTPVQIEMINGIVTRYLDINSYPENKVPQNSFAFIFSEQIEGVSFAEWESSDPTHVGEIFPGSGLYVVAVATDPLTIEAKYDFVENAPQFDSHGESDRGYVSFDLYGNPEKVRLVTEAGNESTQVVPGDDFDYKTQVKSSSVPAGNYRIAAQYETESGKHIWLFSEPFAISYGQTALKYEMSFAVGGSSVEYHIDEVTYGNYTIPDYKDIEGFNEPDDKKFLYWEDEYDSEITYNAGDIIQEVHSEMRFIPHFEDRTPWTVSYDANGGTGSMAGSTVYNERYLTLPECGFVAPEGKVFDHWLIGSDTFVNDETYQVKSNITVQAIWADESSGGGSGGSDAPTSQPTSTPTSGTSGSVGPVDPTSQPTSTPISGTSGSVGPVDPTTSGDTPTPTPSGESSGGISGGAVAGIVIGSVAVAGVGGFSVYWFAISKKSFGELGSAFKNLFSKIFKKK